MKRRSFSFRPVIKERLSFCFDIRISRPSLSSLRSPEPGSAMAEGMTDFPTRPLNVGSRVPPVPAESRSPRFMGDSACRDFTRSNKA